MHPTICQVYIGTAGWSIPAAQVGEFPSHGSTLARYAARLRGVEINSSFYKAPRPSTYARWAYETPEDFRFAVKMPKEITHKRKLLEAEEPLDGFLEGLSALGGRLGPLLIQLPPSLAFEPVMARRFFE